MVYKGIRISEICYNFAAEINSITTVHEDPLTFQKVTN